MGLGRNQLAIGSQEAGRYVMRSALPVNLAEVVQKDRATIVEADEVIVGGAVASAGYSLTIICRVLRFAAGGYIDVSGKSAETSYPAGIPPEQDHTPGAHGLDGADGGVGFRAGAVKIFCVRIEGIADIRAEGGFGGRGQDGGNGRDGQVGSAGENATLKNRYGHIPAQCVGKTGGNGGNAGLPGRRGKGGDGGSIEINVIDFDPTKIQMRSSSGQPGVSADPGKPGVGGSGGQGGTVTNLSCYHEPNPKYLSTPKFALGLNKFDLVERFDEFKKVRPEAKETNLEPLELYAMALDGASASQLQPLRLICEPSEDISAPAGESGKSGDPQSASVVDRQSLPESAKDGVALSRQVSWEYFSAQFKGVILDLLAIAYEDEYLRSGSRLSDALRERIGFLLDICQKDLNPEPNKLDRLAIAYSMAQKSAMGLDIFGYSQERVPLLSFETYSNLIEKTALPLAQRIEDSFNSYWDQAQTQEERRQAIRDASAASEQQVAAFEAEWERVILDAKTLKKELPALDLKVEAAYHLLMERELELNAAISRKSEGCDLVGTLTAAATIVAGISTGGVALIGAASAAKKLYDNYSANNDSISQLWDNRKVLQGDLEELGKNANTVSERITSIQNAVRALTPEQRKLPQFRMERTRFDEIARDFVEFGEAAAYKEAGYDYLKCVEARNQAIVDYNAMLLQVMELQAKLKSAERAVEALKSALARAFDPSEAIIVQLMSRLYLDSLSLSAQMVHAEKKALAYHFARPADAPLSKLNVATIMGAHQKAVLMDWASAKERYRAKRTLEGGELTLDLERMTIPTAWETLKSIGKLAFTVRVDHSEYGPMFDALPGLRLTGMELVLDGVTAAQGQRQVPWTMTQSGHERIYLADKSAQVFSHRMVTFTGFTPLDGGKPIVRPDFSETNLYAGISPYSSWLLQFSAHPALGLDLSGLKSAKLKLFGFMLEG